MFRTAVLLIILCFAFAGVVRGETLFIWEDELDDDFGAGFYLYPTHPHFRPEKGLWDITCFKVKKDGERYYFHFTFQNLTDPWSGFFGFSHPLIHLYIDNEVGGELKALAPLKDIEMDGNSLWNKALVISGWWITGIEAGEVWESPETGVSWDNPRPLSLAGSDVEVEGNTIIVGVEESWLGDLQGAKAYVLVGSYDPLEPDHFRQVNRKPGPWSFGGGKEGYNVPILDILVPEGFTQREILTASPIVLKPIGAIVESIPTENGDPMGLFEMLLLLLLLVGFIVFLCFIRKRAGDYRSYQSSKDGQG